MSTAIKRIAVQAAVAASMRLAEEQAAREAHAKAHPTKECLACRGKGVTKGKRTPCVPCGASGRVSAC